MGVSISDSQKTGAITYARITDITAVTRKEKKLREIDVANTFVLTSGPPEFMYLINPFLMKPILACSRSVVIAIYNAHVPNSEVVITRARIIKLISPSP
jgi:hypothetical protein